jgi:hypothetical protein
MHIVSELAFAFIGMAALAVALPALCKALEFIFD